ncbi:deoxyribodipyrimidine photolyase [Vulgatibacter sp.]|uniref:deoxyribodipyrimidine photolyase n=1 Tax=Vulgatibacter sp. TaxID=1971226 RepID=UPI0035650FB1
MVPAIRIRSCNDAPIRPGGDYVLHWMVAFRRTGWNFALQRSVEHAKALGKPLVVLEALRVGYRWASDRLHRFLLQGFGENRDALAKKPVLYHPYVEPVHGHGKGLLEALAARACVVVTDDYPAFFLPHMLDAAAGRLGVRLEAVDANGLWPMRATQRVFTTAASFRLHLQRNLRPHLEQLPKADPLRGVALPTLRALPRSITARWPAADHALLRGDVGAVAKLPLDHTVPPVELHGGSSAAVQRWRRFLRDRLGSYVDHRNDPDEDAASGLSPWLHFGRISVHQIFSELAAREGWSAERLPKSGGGKRAGWWRMSPGAEAFLDELVTWRELGFNRCALRTADYDRYETLPPWALRTLEDHASDERPQLYTHAALEEARTADPIWNAAQRQLLEEGRIHNYLRMLWGKKVLEWSPTPQAALATLVELNNKYALDGRDPNSWSGILWCFGRYDRAWGPERPIFGKVRYMSSASTARKVHLKRYLERFGDQRER